MSQEAMWATMNHRPRHSAGGLEREDPRTTPGVYVRSPDGEPVYAGVAWSKQGLWGRVWSNHLRIGPDLSRSSFRRNVCEHLGIAPTARTTIRPTAMTPADVEPVKPLDPKLRSGVDQVRDR